MDGGRIAGLDGIRGLAILLVLLFHHIHCAARHGTSSLFEPVARLTWFTFIGVDLFFVLSGFLIGGIVLRNGGTPGFLKRFYLRRAARLFPLYFLVVALYSVSVPFLLAGGTTGGALLARGTTEALPLWSYLVYLQNIFVAVRLNWGAEWLAPTWSLAVEEQFYLIAPVLILMLTRFRLAVVLVLLACISPVLRFVLYEQSQSWLPSYVTLFTRWDALLVGVLGSLAVETPACRQWLQRNGWIVLLVFANASLLIWPMLLSGPIEEFAVLGHTYTALYALNLIAVVLFSPRSWGAGIFEWRPLVALGGISYGVYLIHWPMLWLVRIAYDGQAPRLVDWLDVALSVAALGLSLLLATMSWRHLEKPILARAQSLAFSKPVMAPAAESSTGAFPSPTPA